MFGKWPAALGLLLLFVCHGGATAESEVDPFLPRCEGSHETRIPIPIWDSNHGNVERLRRLISSWPAGTALVVYGSFWAAEDDVHIEGQDKAYSVRMTLREKERETGDVDVSASKPPQFSMGSWAYWGFFEVSPPSSPKGEIALRGLDTFDVVSSARYCLGDGPPPASPREIPAAQKQESGSLPVCRRVHEDRIPIARWKPKLTWSHEGLPQVHEPPPSGNGRIVYISIEDPDEPCDRDRDNPFHPVWPDENPRRDDLYSVLLPESPAADSGGVSINLRGNRTPVGKGCRFEGFYMNEPVAGIHQGWTDNYFGAIDRARIVASNHYCMAR
jgi:hypothetical protein